MKTAVVPGTFDPVTRGHMAVIRYAAKKYDRVYVAVMDNPDKNPICTPKQRVVMIEKCLQGLTNVCALYKPGMLYDFVKELGGADIVKGIRNNDDALYEKAMADYNKRFCGADTIYILATDQMKNISSTTVRDCVKKGIPVDHLVPAEVLQDIISFYGGNK